MSVKNTFTIAAILAMAAGAHANTIFMEDFAGLADGTDIATTNTDFTYVRLSTSAGSGTSLKTQGEHLVFTGPAGGSLTGIGVQNTLSFAGATELNFSVDLNRTAVTGTGGSLVIGLGSGTSFTGNTTFTTNQGLFWLQITSAGVLQRRTGSAWTDVSTIDLNTAYTLSVDANTATGLMDVSLNGTIFADDVALTTPAITPDGFRIYSVGSTGNNVTYSVDNISLGFTSPVPEPATYGLIGAVSLAGFSALRRRRRAK